MRYRNVTQEASFGGRSCNAVAAEEPDFEGGVTKQIRQCSNECGFASNIEVRSISSLHLMVSRTEPSDIISVRSARQDSRFI